MVLRKAYTALVVTLAYVRHYGAAPGLMKMDGSLEKSLRSLKYATVNQRFGMDAVTFDQSQARQEL